MNFFNKVLGFSIGVVASLAGLSFASHVPASTTTPSHFVESEKSNDTRLFNTLKSKLSAKVSLPVDLMAEAHNGASGSKG